MPNIDPKIAGWLGLFLCVANVIGLIGDAGGLHNAIPEWSIPYVIVWCKDINTIGVAVMTYIAGSNATQSGRLQNVQSIPVATRAKDLANDNDIAHVVLKDQAAADAVPSDKVIGPVDLKKAA